MTNRHDAAHEFLLTTSYSHHEHLHKLIKQNGPLIIESYAAEELLFFLARTAVGQQLSARAAKTIWSRIEELQKVLGTDLRAVFRTEHTDELRTCGVSGNKIRAIIGLRDAIDSEFIDGQDILNSSYTAISKKITSLWGFGSWSADMCAMFFCALPDIYPDSDSSIRQGLKRLCGEENEPEEMADRYAPYRTYLCLHVWEGMDSGYFE